MWWLMLIGPWSQPSASKWQGELLVISPPVGLRPRPAPPPLRHRTPASGGDPEDFAVQPGAAPQDRGELVTSARAGQAEFRVDVREMRLDRLQADEQFLGHLGVGAAPGHQPRRAQFAGGQRVDAAAPDAARPGPGHPELLAGPDDQPLGTAAMGELHGGGQRLARLGALASPAKRRPVTPPRAARFPPGPRPA